MKLIRIGVDPQLSTYQCLNCENVTTVKDEAGIDSYFEWLMSRPASKRVAAN
jgi:hypothetical protein